MNISLNKIGSDLFENVYIVTLGAIANYAVKAFVNFISSHYLDFSYNLGAPSQEGGKQVLLLWSMLTIELSYLFGSLAAGYVIGRYAKSRPFVYSAVLGGLLTVANIANILTVPQTHPLWMALITSFTFIPMSLLGCSLAVGKKATVKALKGIHP